MTHENSLIEKDNFNKAVFLQFRQAKLWLECAKSLPGEGFFKIGIEKGRIILYNDISITSVKTGLPPESIWLSAGCLLPVEE